MGVGGRVLLRPAKAGLRRTSSAALQRFPLKLL